MYKSHDNVVLGQVDWNFNRVIKRIQSLENKGRS